MRTHIGSPSLYLLVASSLFVMSSSLLPSQGCKNRISTGGTSLVTVCKPVAARGPGIGNGGSFVLPESTVAIVQSLKAYAKDIGEADIKTMISTAIDLAGGLSSVIHSGNTVILKPNLVTTEDYTGGWGDNPDNKPLPELANGVTTDWRVTKTLAELVDQYNPTGKIYVMESSSEPTDQAFSKLGYSANIPIPKPVTALLAMETDSVAGQGGIVDVLIANPLWLHHQGPATYTLNARYKNADVVISLPTLKTHWYTVITGAIKNVGVGSMPTNVYNRGPTIHGDTNLADLHKWLHDYYLARPVDFVIMDGLQGLQNGPTPSVDVSGSTSLSNEQMNMRMILASRDAVAIDTIEALLMGWDPATVTHLSLLTAKTVAEGGLGKGNSDLGNIRVTGALVDQVRKDFAGETYEFVDKTNMGMKITDKTPPTLSVTGCELAQDQILHLTLAADTDMKRVEILISGQYVSPAAVSNLETISLDIRSVPSGQHDVTVRAFDRFLNRSEVTIKGAIQKS